jgi:mono/diheme cytochrome c family protein
MFRRERLVLCAVLATLLTTCGTPATPEPTPMPTLVFPTRVPIQSAGGAGNQAATVAAQPTAPPTIPPTAAPTHLPASPTPIPPTPTRLSATATLQVAVTTARPAAPVASGNPANGETIFKNGLGDPAVPTCSTCHNTTMPDVKVGPSLRGVATRAGWRVAGQDAATYLRTSILDPNAFLVPNENDHVFSANGVSLMYQDFAERFSETQVNDVVTYLLTLR